MLSWMWKSILSMVKAACSAIIIMCTCSASNNQIRKINSKPGTPNKIIYVDAYKNCLNTIVG